MATTVICEELPYQLISWLTASGLCSPLAVATLDPRQGGHISMAPLSFRSSNSFRVLSQKQCLYEVHFEQGEDDETLRNILADGRVTLQFEVSASTAPSSSTQLVKIQGTGLVHERGSTAYNALMGPPSNSQWLPHSVVSISVHRVAISNAGPSIPIPNFNPSPVPSSPPSRSIPREASMRSPTRTPNRGLISRQVDHTTANWGWPVGGDACCAT